MAMFKVFIEEVAAIYCGQTVTGDKGICQD